MTLDPRTPVLVGVGQLSHRVDQGLDPLEPVDLLVAAARRAEADAGVDRLVAGLDSVRVVNILSSAYTDPGRLVAQRLGATDARTVYTTGGGQTPQALVHRAAEDIGAGRADAVLIGGAEAWRTRRGARRSGEPLAWTEQPDATPDEVVGDDLDMSHPGELAQGIAMPIQVYPLFDVAARVAAALTVDEHRARLGARYARFSEIAAANPHAWSWPPCSRRPSTSARPPTAAPRATSASEPGSPVPPDGAPAAVRLVGAGLQDQDGGLHRPAVGVDVDVTVHLDPTPGSRTG